MEKRKVVGTKKSVGKKMTAIEELKAKKGFAVRKEEKKAVVSVPKKHGLKYEWMIQGPIFITAAHSTRLQRLGLYSGDKNRIHLREEWVAYLAIRLAYHLSKIHAEKKKEEAKEEYKGSNLVAAEKLASFMVWSKDKPFNKDDIDPNYVNEKMYPKSHFYQGLRKWISSLGESDVPFHIDIHGKINRKTDRNIDIGIESMHQEWPYPDKGSLFAKELDILSIEYINNAFVGVKCDNMEVTGITECWLSGYWGEGILTMTTQAVLLGVPSFQLEIPRSVRKALSLDDDLLRKLALNIYNLYSDVVWRLWQEQKLVLNREPYEIDTIENTYKKSTLAEIDQLSKEYLIREKLSKEKLI